ncbi:MAG: hypothetical protein NPIRA02_00550 [Nitrospirales bacterium]|nr:MAG: hypothetical protein NPIRA02_00550 [Nitrospirales bacterium]
MKTSVWLSTDSIVTETKYQTLFPALSSDEYRSLRDDIQNVGILVPLILEHVANEYCVLSGHHRLKAAKELGLKQVPCEIVETQDEQISALFDNLYRRQLSSSELKRLKDVEHKWREESIKQVPASLRSLCAELPLEDILPKSLWSQLIASSSDTLDKMTRSLQRVLDDVKTDASNQAVKKFDQTRSRMPQPVTKKHNNIEKEMEELRRTAVGFSREVQKRDKEIERLEEALEAQKRKITDAEALLHAFELQDPLTITPGIIVDGFNTLTQLVRLLLEWTAQLPNATDEFQGKIDRAIGQLHNLLEDQGRRTRRTKNLRVLNGHKPSQPARRQ